MDAELIADCFDLGPPLCEPVVAASGWGQRNRVWRLDTQRGVFAVKDTIAELLPANRVVAARIESAAHAAGIPCPEPMPSTTGAAFEQLVGRWYRCHRWIDGAAKQNEDTTADDADAMGGVVARLHQLQLRAGPLPPVTRFGRSLWLELVSRSGSAAWGGMISANLGAIETAEAIGATFDDAAPIGSHCDLNAHNVLFTADGLVLVDWDAAGPASASYERASTAVLWARRHDGRFEHDIAAAFLRAYRDHGGTVSIDDVDSLTRWLTGLVWWTERNLQIALAQPSNENDELATMLVSALINGVDTLTEQQQFLNEVITRL